MTISTSNNIRRCVSVYDVANLLVDNTCIIIMDEDDEVIGTVSKKGDIIDYIMDNLMLCPDEMHEPLHATKVQGISTDDKMNIIIHI